MSGPASWIGSGPSPTGGAQTANVATDQSTASTSYTDLATSGPAVTLNVPPSGIVLLILQANLYSSGVGVAAQMSFAASGANTIAAADTKSLRQSTNLILSASATFLLTGLTPGSTTFTAKYNTSSGTSNFGNRNITVIPI